jgi:hypothetical protein
VIIPPGEKRIVGILIQNTATGANELIGMDALRARLGDIQACVEAATPGPWTTGAGKVEGGQTRELVIAPNDDVIVAIAYGGFGNPVDRTTQDRTFIANSRADVPFLLGVVEALLVSLDAYAEAAR